MSTPTGTMTEGRARAGEPAATWDQVPGLALERCNPAILDCRQFACPQAVFDFLLKQNIFQANETAGSLVIILQAGRLLVCRQADF